MPATTERQRKFFGAELGRARAGKKTQTKLPTEKLREFAMKVKKPKRDGSY
jgi:hypothetical protein